MQNKLCLITIAALLFNYSIAQNSRLNDHNTIGWISNTATITLKSKWSAHIEYQWRRAHLFEIWQQSLVRIGINYQLNEKVQFRVGLASVHTYPYGEYTLQAAGKPFPEHRIFEVVTITDKIKQLSLMHRFMLEQRWVGRYSNASLAKTDITTFTNRIRYMIRLQHGINHKEMKDNTLYAAAFNELFIDFGNNVGENIFDQNRIAVLMGYRINKNVRLEAGFLNQTLQLGREINGNNIIQYNNGILISGFYNF